MYKITGTGQTVVDTPFSGRRKARRKETCVLIILSINDVASISALSRTLDYFSWNRAGDSENLTASLKTPVGYL